MRRKGKPITRDTFNDRLSAKLKAERVFAKTAAKHPKILAGIVISTVALAMVLVVKIWIGY